MQFDYDGRVFCTVSNSENGEVNGETRFCYRQQGDVVWASYSGGGVRMGTLLARVLADGALDMRYQHLNAAGEFMNGECRSLPELLPDGRYRMHEEWHWLCGDGSRGSSVVEEVRER